MSTPALEEPRGTWPAAGLAAVLTAVVVGLAVFTGFEVYDVVDAEQDSQLQSVQVIDEDARTAVLMAATDLSQRVLTYHHDTFEEDLEIATARSTPDFRVEYDSAMEQVRANTRKFKISQEATVVSSAIISATADEAQVLVFINQETSSARTRANQLVRSRFVVDLVRLDAQRTDGAAEGDTNGQGTEDQWAIAEVNALG